MKNWRQFVKENKFFPAWSQATATAFIYWSADLGKS